MCGSATLAMEESSTSMNVASVTVMAITHGLTRVVLSGARGAPGRLPQPYRGLDGHSRPKLFQIILTGVKPDANRHALNHLDVVARCVFRRQDAAARAGNGGDALDRAFEVLLQRIDMDLRPLPGVHFGKLRLLEICSDPSIPVATIIIRG